MADCHKIIPFIKQHEGGWSDKKSDKGGATMLGVTLKTYTQYCLQHHRSAPTKNDLRHISADDWFCIYRLYYWNSIQGDYIKSQSIADLLVDWCWASGKWAIIHCQRIVCVKDDGIFGTQTLAAVNKWDARELFNRLHADRIVFCNNIVKENPDQKVNLNGWLRRIDDMKFHD
jgi:lysozyme family protein